MDAPPRVTISAVAPGYAARSWSAASRLRIGRLPDQEVAIEHPSVSRRHAEVVLDEDGWVVRDLGSSNGTYLNGARLGRHPHRVRPGDVVRVGGQELRVDFAHELSGTVRVGSRVVHIQAARHPRSDAGGWTGAAGDQQDAEHLLRLIRAGNGLAHAGPLDAELQRVLDEAVTLFGAQRGGLLFPAGAAGATGPAGPLQVRCVSVSAERPTPPRKVSRTPAARAFDGKASLLFRDATTAPELASADSVARGTATSIVCAVIQSPDEAFGVLHLDRGPHQPPFTEADLDRADALAAALGVGLERIHAAERRQETLAQTMTALAQAVELRDLYTGDHTGRVTTYSLLLAAELGLPAELRQVLRAAAALHDIGKIAVDDAILRKPGPLSTAEFDRMKTHVTRGAEIIETVPELSWALPVIRSHHERWDGRGYPDGLAGEEIPLTARVVAVADAFDAMNSDRPYRLGMSVEAAFAEVRAGTGKQFDPRCAEAFLRIRPKVEALIEDERVFRQRAVTGTTTVSVRELRREVADTPPPVGLPTPAPAAGGV